MVRLNQAGLPSGCSIGSTHLARNHVNDPPDALHFLVYRSNLSSLGDKSFEDFYPPPEICDQSILLLALLGECCNLDLKKLYHIHGYPHSRSASVPLPAYVTADRSCKADDDCDDGFSAHFPSPIYTDSATVRMVTVRYPPSVEPSGPGGAV